MLKRIGRQIYRLALPDKYSRLHNIFPVQLLKSYNLRDHSEPYLPMPDLEHDEEEWAV